MQATAQRPISPRNLAILQGLAEGRTCGEIAAQLNISVYTVYQYVQRQCRKEHVRGPMGLVVKAIRDRHLDPNRLNVEVG